jgi:hypothetical protein
MAREVLLEYCLACVARFAECLKIRDRASAAKRTGQDVVEGEPLGGSAAQASPTVALEDAFSQLLPPSFRVRHVCESIGEY